MEFQCQYQEEYIRNSRGVKLFTCRWLPTSPPKALVFLCHGYGMECSGYMKECGIRLASASYAVFGIDYEGHGKSPGSRCYIKKFENIVKDCNEFFKSVCVEKDYRDKGRFLYGESMGGAVALLLHRKEPSFYNGAVLVAPMCKISEKLKPHPVVVNILTSLEEIIPKWKIVPTKDVIDSAFRDPVKREEVTLPFLVLHGDADIVTDPEISKALYEQAGSVDKTMKLYPGMWHGLTAGEIDGNVDIVFEDIIGWLDKHTDYLVPVPILEPFSNGIEKLEWPETENLSQRKQSNRSYLCGFKEPCTLHSAM
ncbi:caffeoylshikimate esterase isoform X2 [Ricinus communis]|uniref:caffeoylshikimate esterase isoform X2 n=1 Tax=Ricinus communis TaxID=3988 RepID=UPI00077298FC|nr:caffeoylshikimate esterase isoform X2 [Ricinus communis]|eukprot:XP_015577213.1 caffeoylshikimate esterase isoform X2 [Ricinus communis]